MAESTRWLDDFFNSVYDAGLYAGYNTSLPEQDPIGINFSTSTDPEADVDEAQAEIELVTAREEERAERGAAYRRGELADRTGYSGTVLVGDAAERTDATLAAEMAALPPGDPTRVAYEQAKAEEAKQTAEDIRIQTGEQYDVEDAYLASKEVYYGPDSTEVEKRAAKAEMDEIRRENPWFDPKVNDPTYDPADTPPTSELEYNPTYDTPTVLPFADDPYFYGPKYDDGTSTDEPIVQAPISMRTEPQPGDEDYDIWEDPIAGWWNYYSSFWR